MSEFNKEVILLLSIASVCLAAVGVIYYLTKRREDEDSER